MRTFPSFLAVLLIAAPAWALTPAQKAALLGGPKFTLLAHTSVSSTDGNSLITPSINVSGANLILLNVSCYQSCGSLPISDTLNNTWNKAVTANNSNNEFTIIYYCSPCIATGNDAFSITSLNDFPSMSVEAWRDSNGVPHLDVTNTNTGNGVTTLQSGAVSPSRSGELLVTGINPPTGGNVPTSINGRFTISDTQTAVNGVSVGNGMAYLAGASQSTANPTWTVSSSDNMSAAIVTFAP